MEIDYSIKDKENLFSHQQWSWDYNNLTQIIDETHGEANISLSSDYTNIGDKSLKISRYINTPTQYSYGKIVIPLTEDSLNKRVNLTCNILTTNCTFQIALSLWNSDSSGHTSFTVINIPPNNKFTGIELSQNISSSEWTYVEVRLQLTPSENNCDVYLDNFKLTIQ